MFPQMSIILSGLIHVFQPLLSSLSGSLTCEGLGPWYFLLGLRIVAIFFSNGPWDTIKEDVACNWVHPMHERSRDFCTALCHNQHFPISVSATWGLVFIALLLLVGLMKLTSPPKKKDKHSDRDDEDRDKDKLAIVAIAPHRSSADISTIYRVGPRGLTGNNNRRSSSRSPRPDSLRHAPWSDWYGPPAAFGPGGPDTDVGFGPSEVGGYGMPVYSRPVGQPRMPDQGYNMSQRKMSVCPMDRKQTKSSMHCPGTDQYEMSILHNPMRQTDVAPPYDETAQYMPTKCAPVPVNSSSYEGCVPPHCWLSDEHSESIQQRYMDQEECGIRESPDSSSTACMYTMGTPNRYVGQSKMAPQYCEDGRYSMATQCRPVTKCNAVNIAVPPWEDGKANVAIKRRPVPGSKMPTKRRVTFDATGCNEMGFGSNVSSQPWPAGNVPMPDNGTCAETDPCCMDTRCGPQCEPCGGEEATPTGPSESLPGPQDKAKMSISRICGIPLFDLWVGLLLATEIGFLLAVVLLQLPRLVGRTWICVPGATSCPQSVECAVRGRAEKRVALWGLVFTSILFIIGCSAYFHLRMCGTKRCRGMCAKKEEEREEREEARAADTEPEGRVFRGDLEGGHEEEMTGGE